MNATARGVEIQAGPVTLCADLCLPDRAVGIVLFAHGSGSSRHSPRNQCVARTLQEARLATLLLDLLTPEEEAFDENTARLRFDIRLLADRLVHATDWLRGQPDARELPIGYFGASTGAAAALMAAAQRPSVVRGVVSRGGRPDLASAALPDVKAPTLLIVGSNDAPVIGMNKEAMRQLCCPLKLEIVPGASHLFEEPGALAHVARLASEWFVKHLLPRPV